MLYLTVGRCEKKTGTSVATAPHDIGSPVQIASPLATATRHVPAVFCASGIDTFLRTLDYDLDATASLAHGMLS